VGLALDYIEGQSLLEEDEKEGILIKTVTTQEELDELEQLNIERAIAWTIGKKFKPATIFTEQFIKKVHKQMFGDVWKWAGSFRKSEKNIGIEWIKIGVELKYLLDDTTYWAEKKTYPSDEIAIRFKHRLVKIHCFPDGNGRHSRLMADIIIESVFNKEVFPWHRSNMVKPDETRKLYLAAIRVGDNGNIQPLIEFARN